MKKIIPSISFVLFLCIQFCIIQQVYAKETHTIASDDYFNDDYFEDDYQEENTEQKSDTFYAWNIFWHNVNDITLTKIAEPAHKQYSKVVLPPMRSCIENFGHNLGTPKRMLNAILQAEFAQAFIELGRFIINTTSSLGFADVAQFHKPLYPYNPDSLCFGYTFARWGIGEGPYFVIPFLGPSTIRESVGTLLDSASSAYSYFVPLYVSLPAEALFAFNTLDDVYIPYENLKANAFEPYIAIKNAYLENLDYKRP